MTYFDEEEQFWIEAAERGELRPVENQEEAIAQLKASAQKTLKKDARISLRMTSADVARFKRLAAREGMPYQTYISSVLHKYVNKQLTLDD